MPRRPTLRKLAEWYALRLHGAAARPPMAPLVGLAMLVEGLSDSEARRLASTEIVEIGLARYLAAGPDAPAWLIAVIPLLLGRRAAARYAGARQGAEDNTRERYLMRVPRCPHCLVELPQYRNLSDPGRAHPGQIALCIFCEQFSVIAQDFSLRIPDPAEAAQIAADPGSGRAIATLRAIKAATHGLDDPAVPVCPACGEPNRTAVGLQGDPAEPKAGHLSLCLRCGGISRYTSSLAGHYLRPLTSVERRRLLEAAARARGLN